MGLRLKCKNQNSTSAVDVTSARKRRGARPAFRADVTPSESSPSDLGIGGLRRLLTRDLHADTEVGANRAINGRVSARFASYWAAAPHAAILGSCGTTIFGFLGRS